MTETELKNLVKRAQDAEELFNHPLLQEFIIAVRGKLLAEFESTELTDDEKRKDAWRKSQLLNSFLDEFKKTIKEGKSAKLTLAERAKQAARRIF